MEHPCVIRDIDCRLTRNAVVAALLTLCAIAALPNYFCPQAQACFFTQPNADSGGWIFKNAPYTNDAKTGQRVDQYRPEKTPYRDPYAIYDSPHECYPFEPDSGDSFFFGVPYFSSALSPYLNPNSYNSEISPYDGDPND